MKHFKLMSFMLALIACTFTFVACGDDDDDDNGDEGNVATIYVGTWQAYEMEIMGMTVPVEYYADDPTGYMEIELDAQRKGTITLWTDDGPVRSNVTWQASGRGITMSYQGSDQKLTYDDATQSLTWKWAMTDQYGQSATYRFKKKK